MIDDLIRDELRALAKYEIPHPENIRARLDANESPFAISPATADALGRELAKVALHRYPDGDARVLRGVLARECGVPGNQLVIGNGSDELIELIIAAFARPRAVGVPARIAYPVPSFVVYRIASFSNGTTPCEIPLTPRWELDLDAVERAIATDRPNVIFFALPNNPTGTLWPHEAVLAIAQKHRDVIVVSDEAYFDYAGVSLLDKLAANPNLVIMRTLSKIGLAGLRCGWIIAAQNIIDTVEKIRPPYNVGSLNQAAAVWLLENARDELRSHIRRVVDERERVAKAIADVVEVFPSRANFLLVRHAQATALWQRLCSRGVLVRNFDRPGSPLTGCLRVTIGTPSENDLLLEALRSS
jgi:histidinol-phosphate aminotransferase